MNEQAGVNEQWRALDDAWSTAVKLPDGWRLRSIERNGIDVEYVGGRKKYVEWWEACARGPEDREVTEIGSWPVDALVQLVRKLFSESEPMPPLLAGKLRERPAP